MSNTTENEKEAAGNESVEENNGMDEAYLQEALSHHGGDPRQLDLGKCLLVSNLPSSFLSDPFEVFSECIYDLLCEDFNVSREVLEKVIRIPKLQADAENQDTALRAIVSFKSRVHKHRIFAQKKIAGDSSFKVNTLDEIPKEFIEIEEDLEMADEIGGDEEGLEEVDEEGPTGEEDEDMVADAPAEENGDDQIDEIQEEDVAEQSEHDETTETVHVDQKAVKEEAKENVEISSDVEKKESTTEKVEKDIKTEKERPVYVDEDKDAPYETNWEGAPEFQWKLCPSANDTRRLIMENICWSDLRDPFIYRTLQRAESIDISFPTRYNTEGNKQLFGKVTMIFQYANQIMTEAMSHLVYQRCPGGRRIKVFLPQTSHAMKMKEQFEAHLGRTIKPTPRMHQIVLKTVPKEHVVTLDEAKKLFPDQTVTEVEMSKDELGQSVALITMGTVDDAITAHASRAFVVIDDQKIHVFLRGVEAHHGSLTTRWDKQESKKKDEKEKVKDKKDERPSTKSSSTSSSKRPAPSGTDKSPFPKKSRPNSMSTSRGSNNTTPRGGRSGAFARGVVRGGSSYGARGGGAARGPSRGPPPRAAAFRGGRGGPSDRGGRFGSSRPGGPSPSSRAARIAPFESRYDIEEKYRMQRKELEMQEEIMKQQQYITHMQNKLEEQRERDRQLGLSRSAFDIDRGSGFTRDTFGSSLSSRTSGGYGGLGGSSAFGTSSYLGSASSSGYTSGGIGGSYGGSSLGGGSGGGYGSTQQRSSYSGGSGGGGSYSSGGGHGQYGDSRRRRDY